MGYDTFTPFSRLPTELREEIWRFCLPHRVSELDDPAAFMVYDSFDPDDKLPCSLQSTSYSNRRPPLLTRVCRESRRIAFQSSSLVSVLRCWEGEIPDRVREDDWQAANFINYCWQDLVRDSAHLNWTLAYDIELSCTIDGHPFIALVQESKLRNRSASIMLDYISDYLGEREPFDKPITRSLQSIPISRSRQEDLAALKLLPEWLVVIRVVIVHLDLARAAKTGLFGLSGDEFVQVIDATLPLASQLYELAETCERVARAVTVGQNFARISANDMDAMVKRVAFKAYHDHELSERMRPAIMFRLCTQMCNHSNSLGEERNI